MGETTGLRVLIISDMEGVSGISRWEQVIAGKPMYQEGRHLYTADVNAAIRGAFAGGATDVCVMDWHGAGGGYSFNSLIPKDLDPRCTFIVQERVPGFTGMFDPPRHAALLIGMHARAGTPDGIMSHTIFGSHIQNVWFNGALVGETGVNAALCGQFGCPVVLVTGDSVTCEQAKELLGFDVMTVSVKRGLGPASGVMIPPVRAREMIEAGATEALAKRSRAPYVPGSPSVIEVEFKTVAAFVEYSARPGVEVTGDSRIRTTGDDWWTAWSTFIGVSAYTPT